jgi:hypothetical protein
MAQDSIDQDNKNAKESVTVVNLDVWLFKLKKTVAKLQENLVKKDEKINELTERLSKLEKRSGGGSTPG